MNERIEQLANEVGISVEYLTNTKQWPLIEALAELIVKDCVSVVQSYRMKMDASNENIVVAIRDHFGIK